MMWALVKGRGGDAEAESYLIFLWQVQTYQVSLLCLIDLYDEHINKRMSSMYRR